MRTCLKRGLGFTVCPEIAVEPELRQKRLVRLAPENDKDEASLIMIWHAEKWCSPLLTDFMRLSEAVMGEQKRQ